MIAPHTLVPTYSVVIPFFNEAESLGTLLAELRAVMDALGEPYEAIFINDGSRDATGARLSAIGETWPEAKVISLAKNQGQAAALWRGFEEATGLWIITMDGDGQNAPGDIPALIELTQGCDMAVGIRAQRRDTWLRRAMSRLANTVRGSLLGDHMQDSGCALKVFRHEIIASFWPIRSLYSFMPAFAIAAGFKLGEIPVQHRERRAGKSNYGFLAFAWKPTCDLIALWWVLRRRIRR